jgi:regulator of protease activity HflC (stomatin/prohibitin superfamily)
MFVLRYRRGALTRSGRGQAFFFLPHASSIAEVPVDDREMAFSFRSRTSDYQEVTAQGVITFRVKDPRRLADRIDFTIDLESGVLLRQPLEKLSLLFSQVAEQRARAWVASVPLRRVLAEGPPALRHEIQLAFREERALDDLGLELVSIRISSIRPSADLDRALEAPARELIQQQGDEATFARRANAVEKERTIQENELQTQVELARRQEELIAQKGLNAQREATEEASASRIASEGKAERGRIESQGRRRDAPAPRRGRGARGHRPRRGEGDRPPSPGRRSRGRGEGADGGGPQRARAGAAGPRRPGPGRQAGEDRALSLGEPVLAPTLARLLEASASHLGKE